MGIAGGGGGGELAGPGRLCGARQPHQAPIWCEPLRPRLL